jgi:hypothetical protein
MTCGNGPRLDMFSIRALSPGSQNMQTSWLLTNKSFMAAVLPLPHDRSEIATGNILDHKGESFFQDSVVNRIYNNSEYFWLITVCSAATLSLEMNDNKLLERRFIQI